MVTAGEIRSQLLEAIAARDADAFELALNSAFRADLPGDLADVFAEALLMPWHHSHEDLAGALQDLKDPRSIDALFKAAHSRHDYLDYDEFYGLARKCTWALADIGTLDAKERLQQLARSPNATITGYAQKRLDHWQEELSRKGCRPVGDR